jgi:hypothetical protein
MKKELEVKMKRILIICILLSAVYVCMADDQMSPVDNHRQGITTPAENLKLPPHNRTVYNFMIPPMSLLTSYWDYQIGGYTSLATRVQAPNAGHGVYLSYMGQRTPTGQRRVFVTYIDASGSPVTNNELTSTQVREGYITQDIDRVSGKPFFAWHVNSDPLDADLEVNTNWDSFLEGIPGLFSEPTITINNTIPLTINNVAYNDNEFIWPVVQIGPSPLPDHRRVYVFASNSVSHSNPANASENAYYAYADFTPLQLEENTEPLSWTYKTISLMDNWNTDQTAWRRFFHATVVGDDGNLYKIGYHVGELADTTPIDEPYLDVLVNSNYGEGDWIQYSINPDIDVAAPDSTFEISGGGYYTTLSYEVIEGTNDNGYITPDGHLHYPLFFGLITPDNTYYTLLQYLKDVDFNVVDHTFLIHDLYPTGVHPNDGNPVMPWDMDEDGIVDTTETGSVALTPTWPFVYWDQTVYSTLLFDYNTVKFTRVNDQGMVACVWSSSLNAKLYNDNPTVYPELAAYTGVPEIFISVYPVPGNEGPQWSEPLSLNSVDTPEMHPGGDPIIPEWVYPGDYIEYLGVTAEGYKVGKLHLLYFDDNTWGAGCLTNPVGQNDGGRVQYAALELAWSPGTPVQGPIVGNDDNTNSIKPVLSQNYPNPFNPSTTIAYNISKPGKVALTIYNVKGQKVRSLVNEIKPIGHYTVTWDGLSENGTKVGSGVYFYRLENNGKSMTRKMVVLK